MSFSLAPAYRSGGAAKAADWPTLAAAKSVCETAARAFTRHLAPTLPSCLALAGIAACTWGSFRLGQTFAFTGFLYLVFVVLAALYGGFWQATVISVAAAACLNYYFVPPIFSFANSPANWVALSTFEFTALVISRLSQRAQMRAREAIADRRDIERLYETSRRILLLSSSGEPGNPIPLLIRNIFDLRAVELFDAHSATMYRNGDVPTAAEQHTRDAYFRGTDTFDAETRSWYCVVCVGVRPVGGLALIDTEMTKLAATALASLGGIALERARTLQREYRAQAARQTEQLRTAVLDALAHEFKTPLAVARTASSGLLAVGGLSELQTELVTTIDQQADKLDRLASRLLRTAMLDNAEFKPQREPLPFSVLIDAVLRKFESPADRDRFHVSGPTRDALVLADRELILTAIAQLFDNAVKYSEPGSPIDIRVAAKNSETVLTIRTKGVVVTSSDSERIFERFYRAPDTHYLPAGTGLGLSIVKKIVDAHCGSVWAEGEANYGTSFSLALPAADTY
jgi:two-component system sensor histidine kinase KdpD